MGTYQHESPNPENPRGQRVRRLPGGETFVEGLLELIAARLQLGRVGRVLGGGFVQWGPSVMMSAPGPESQTETIHHDVGREWAQ